MADLSEVESALVNLIGAAIFPPSNAGYGGPIGYGVAGGYETAWPSAQQLAPALGFTVKLYRGWPEAAALANDLTAGTMHVSVFPEGGMTRNTTRHFAQRFAIGGVVAPTITATASGNQVTIGGSITAGNVVGIKLGGPAQQAAHAVIVRATDSLPSIAASLAALIPGASASGAVVTLPIAIGVTAATMVPQPVALEVRRQDQGFRVSCWCATPTARDRLAGAIDNALAGLTDATGAPTRFFVLKQGERGWLRYRSTYTNDFPARDRVWRRDLCYLVEYPTTLIEQDPVMLFGGGSSNGGLMFGPTPPP